MPAFQDGDDISQRRTKREKVQAGNTGQCSKNELDTLMNSVPAAGYIPGAKGNGKGVQRMTGNIYKNGYCTYH
ncbi:hypothetical protein Lac2_12530 [Claveliimonas bilis]|nr:hypothetical protein Lac2_12530 [Claveliimonas bilis]